MSDYRRVCPVTSWADLERLLLIGEAGLHVDSAMRAHLSMVEVEVCRHVGGDHLDVGDALLLPGRMDRG